MRVTTWNVNGLRAALRKGLPKHLSILEPDVLMLQEIRALPEQLPADWRDPAGWHAIWNPAERKGYAGTATWSRLPHELLHTGMNAPDPEGRVLHTRAGGVHFLNIYLPSGSRSSEAQARKEDWMNRFFAWTRAFSQLDEPVILAGDLNIAHTPQDIHNPTGNKRNSGFLPHERAWFTELLASGWFDLLREHVGDTKGPYSWWSNRGRARELDRGWRIDYLLANAAAHRSVRRVWVHRPGGLEVSDHAPVTVEFEPS